MRPYLENLSHDPATAISLSPPAWTWNKGSFRDRSSIIPGPTARFIHQLQTACGSTPRQSTPAQHVVGRTSGQPLHGELYQPQGSLPRHPSRGYVQACWPGEPPRSATAPSATSSTSISCGAWLTHECSATIIQKEPPRCRPNSPQPELPSKNEHPTPNKRLADPGPKGRPSPSRGSASFAPPFRHLYH
jgi:hypothetical protein